MDGKNSVRGIESQLKLNACDERGQATTSKKLLTNTRERPVWGKHNNGGLREERSGTKGIRSTPIIYLGDMDWEKKKRKNDRGSET